MALDRIQPSRQPTASDTLAALIGILPRREGRRGESTLVSYGIAATLSARVRETREGSCPTVGNAGGRNLRLKRTISRTFVALRKRTYKSLYVRLSDHATQAGTFAQTETVDRKD